MGQATSNQAGSSTFYAHGGPGPHHSNQPPLKFSSKHGDNCQIIQDGAKAKRNESFCKGILFSDRSVECYERVCIRLSELSIRWSGVLRIGFTSHNPETIQSLPKYACPDLTGKPGYWAKALGERYAESNALVHYYFTPNGDVHFGVNGVDKGQFFSGVDTRVPVWCLIDLYGNCTAIEFVDMRRSLNNFARTSGGFPEPLPTPVSTNPALSHDQEEEEEEETVANSLNDLSLSSNEPEMPLRFNSNITFRPDAFHASTGPNVSLNGSSTTAWRHDDEYSNGYVFTGSPVRCGERLVIQVLATENMYIGSLAFGLTSCDPATIDTEDLPEDSDMLLDRPEYWVVSKDVANTPDVGDELSFAINGDGTVEFSKNGNIPSTFMHVDNSVDLWAFWDIYGNTQKLRLVGATIDPVIRADQIRQNSTASIENDRNNLSMSDLVVELPEGLHPVNPDQPPVPPARRSQSSHAITNPTCTAHPQPSSSRGRAASTAGPPAPGGSERSEECKICYENQVDCVLYVCGHMCLCYECAFQQWKGRGGGICPMCRNTIQDVIKIYRS